MKLLTDQEYQDKRAKIIVQLWTGFGSPKLTPSTNQYYSGRRASRFEFLPGQLNENRNQTAFHGNFPGSINSWKKPCRSAGFNIWVGMVQSMKFYIRISWPRNSSACQGTQRKSKRTASSKC